MSPHAERILLWLLLVSACGDAPPPRHTDGGASSDASAEGDADAGPDDAGRDGGPGGCSLDLEGTTCRGDERCTSTDGCLEVRCDCDGGAYACVQVVACVAECPQPAETDCGSPCSGDLSECLCRCGGPNYSSCACVSASWSCPHCGGGE